MESLNIFDRNNISLIFKLKFILLKKRKVSLIPIAYGVKVKTNEKSVNVEAIKDRYNGFGLLSIK